MTNRNSMFSSAKKALLLAVAVALCTALPARAAADQDFTLNNHTGKIMKALFVSPVGTDSWGSDIMGSDVLADGASVDVKFERNEDQCNWDVRGEFEDGAYAEVRNVDFCTVSTVNFNP
jgi:hypothetical protein